MAITILAFLMTNVYTIISNSTESKDRIVEEDREKIQLEFAIERVVQDFEQIYSPLFHHSQIDPKQKVGASEFGDDYIDEPQEASYDASERFPISTYKSHLVPAFDSPDKNSIVFLSSSNRRRLQDSKQSRFNWVKYELRSPEEEEKNQREGEVLIRKSVAENIYSGEHSWDDTRGYILLKNIKRLEFMFWNEDSKKFVSSPTELNEKKNQIRMIKLQMTWLAPDETEIEIVRYIRSLWPFFNLKKDEKLIKEAFKKKSIPGSNPDEEFTE